MLVLTRKQGQTIDVGHGLVKFIVKRITGRSVVLCVDAPRELAINRGEIELKIQKEGQTDAA